MVQVRIHIILDQRGQTVDVVLQLRLPLIITVRLLDQMDLAFQIHAEIQNVIDRLPALALRCRVKQALGELLRLFHFLDRKAVRIVALHHVVIHFQVDLLFKVLVELRCRGDIVQDL